MTSESSAHKPESVGPTQPFETESDFINMTTGVRENPYTQTEDDILALKTAVGVPTIAGFVTKLFLAQSDRYAGDATEIGLRVGLGTFVILGGTLLVTTVMDRKSRQV